MDNVSRFERAARIIVRALFAEVLRNIAPELDAVDSPTAKDASTLPLLSESLGFDVVAVIQTAGSKYHLGTPPSAQQLGAFLAGVISTIETHLRPNINALHGKRATSAFMAAALLEVAAILAQFTAMRDDLTVLTPAIDLALRKADIFFAELGVKVHTETTDIFQRLLEYDRKLSITIGDTNDDRFDYGVFLSYATQDNDVAVKIYHALTQSKVRCFKADETIIAGELWEEHTRKALLSSRVAVVLLTPNSISSQWVLCEVGACWALNKPMIPALMGIANSQLPSFVSKRQTIRVETEEGRNELIRLILQHGQIRESEAQHIELDPSPTSG